MKRRIDFSISVILIGLVVHVKGNYDGNSTSLHSKQEFNHSTSSNVGTTPDSTMISPLESIHSLIPESCSQIEDNIFNCTNPGGYFDIKFGKKGISTYNLLLEPKEDAIFYFAKGNIPYLGEDCSIKIGEQLFDKRDQLKENYIHLFNVSTKLLLKNENQNCSFKMFYKISLPYIASAQLLDLEGTIEAPVDPDGVQNYRPMTTFIWYIEPSAEKCFLELEITKFDLGSTTDAQISPGTESLTEQYDFVSIGLGINGSYDFDDYTFFGQWIVPASETLPSCSARITFSSKMHYQDAAGFQIHYRTKDYIKTETNIDPSISLSTWVAINGADIKHNESVENIFPQVKQIIVEMATNYLTDKKIGVTVSETNVTIYEVGSCSIFYCQYNCMAFRFSVELNNDEDEPIFSTDTLNDMIMNTEIITVVGSFQICHEIPYINWSFPIFFLLLVVLCSFALISLAICEKDDSYKQKRRDNLRYIISEWDTTWKRQSFSDISNSSASAQIPFVKKRFYFPGFGNKKKSNVTDYPKYEVTEFKEFKSKPVDPSSLGLDEVKPNLTPKSMQFFNNAFNDDNEIFNKYGSLDIPTSRIHGTPNIAAEQSFSDANPFRSQMMSGKTHK